MPSKITIQVKLSGEANAAECDERLKRRIRAMHRKSTRELVQRITTQLPNLHTAVEDR